MEQSADYIVAGVGSAGCVLARRLADTGGNTNAPAMMIGEHCASLMGGRTRGRELVTSS
jgi:choline dehydrogenase-like flavoprotein